MKYLSNPLCEFKPLFKLTKKKKNIVSSSFFKIHGGGYKKMDRYINGIRYVNKFIVEEMENFIHRLFVDESIYNDQKIMKVLRRLKIEIVVYKCPNYMVGDKHHMGTFGTIVRFFPMFDFPGNDAKIVLISDIDDQRYEVTLTGKLSQTYNLFTGLTKRGFIDKINYATGVKFFKQDVEMEHIIADRQITKGDLDSKTLIKFIKKVSKTSERLSYYPKDMNLIDKTSGNFIYGVDEWFINHDLIKQIKKEKIPMAVEIRNKLIGYIKTRLFLYKPTQEEIREYKNFFKWVLPRQDFNNVYDAFENIKEGYNSGDQEMILRIYEYFISVYGTIKEKYYGKKFLDHTLSPEYLGVYGYVQVMFYNTSIENYFFKKAKLPPEYIKYLKSLI